MSEPAGEEVLLKSRRYSIIKYRLEIIETLYLLIILVLFQGLSLSKALAAWVSSLTAYSFFSSIIYLLAACLGYYILNFPLTLYRSFTLEHSFGLSNQKLPDWLKDQLKAGIVSYVIALILIEVFYLILNLSPGGWWIWVSVFWIFFSLILAKLVPVLIIPLFFKYKKLTDENLRQRIIALAQKMRVKIMDVFEIDFSKKTLKANAAFVGSGNTRRVILADTLKDKYSYDEIEVILAHEFAHYKLKHLLKLILANSLVTILAFYLIFRSSTRVLGVFGLGSLSDIAALPIVLLYLVIFSVLMQPFANALSRRLEKNADRMALSITGLKEAFVSMMEKLAAQNLADRNPSKLIKIYFFDHPPIDERIAMGRVFAEK
ncbi:MAG: M48 family metallopeptidase [Candidatus Omnitrophica bacterium]|nr:M48 family metallopeptidase [Candidatus Omnitrophota bacterium]